MPRAIAATLGCWSSHAPAERRGERPGRSGADPRDLLEPLHRAGKTRDVWDRLAVLSGVFSFVSSITLRSPTTLGRSTSPKRRTSAKWGIKELQNRITEMETAEKMIPHLVADEARKKAATLSLLARPELASRIGEAFGGTGSVAALQQIAEGGRGSGRAAAVSALAGLAQREGSEDAAVQGACPRADPLRATRRFGVCAGRRCHPTLQTILEKTNSRAQL